MKRSLFLICALILALIAALHPLTASAQDSGHYENPVLGVAFDLPAGWEVADGNGQLAAAATGDLATIQGGGVPAGLAVRIVIGSFNELGITDAAELPNLLTHLIPSGVTAPTPEPVQLGGGSGYQATVVLSDEGLTTRIALLAIAGGRVAVVRALAPSAVWDGGAAAQFDTLAQSLVFTLPQHGENVLERVISNDGGVFWQYQELPPDSGRIVSAGGITYDMFGVMYMAVGSGGLLAIDMTTGERISYMGPWIDCNLVDLAIGPDTKLYAANIADNDNAVMVIDRAGNWNWSWGARGNADGEFAPGMPITIAIAPNGDVWTISEGHSEGISNRLYHFDNFGNLKQTIDLSAINPALSGIHMDINQKTGALYLVGATGFLNVLDANGQPLVLNLAEELLSSLTPVDITITRDDNVIIALPAPGLDGFGLIEVSVTGALLDVFGMPFDSTRGGAFLPGEYLRPAGMVVAPDGTNYWTETNPDTHYTQVQAFSFTGDGTMPLGSETNPQAASQWSQHSSLRSVAGWRPD